MVSVTSCFISSPLFLLGVKFCVHVPRKERNSDHNVVCTLCWFVCSRPQLCVSRLVLSSHVIHVFAACVLISSWFVLGWVCRSLITPVLMPAFFYRLHFGLWTYRPQLLIIKACSFFCMPASALWQMIHLTDDGAILSPGQQRQKDPSLVTLEYQQ